jgi:hypothetical protein
MKQMSKKGGKITSPVHRQQIFAGLNDNVQIEKRKFSQNFLLLFGLKSRNVVLGLGIQILSLIIFSFKKQGKVKPNFSLSDDKSFK